jgi:hypothetical protein
MTVRWNRRKRALEYALCIVYDDDHKPIGAAYYKPGETTDLALVGSTWEIEAVDRHNMPGIPV